LESWLQPWLFIALLFLRRIGEGFRSVPAVLKSKGLESWLYPRLFYVHCPAVLEVNWRRIAICTCCFKEEGIVELAQALAVNCPAVLEKGESEEFRFVPAVLKMTVLESCLQPWLFIALLS
jgi:hypothetical protein